jgi:ABC-type Fe3+/spermidine/putrescine transport system ATPase subunit
LSNLDARLREEVRFEIREIAKQIGVPVLYVTHDQTEALDLADRVAVMDKGRILQVDTPEGVYDRPANATVANFLGSMNWLAGQEAGKDRIETPLGMLHLPGRGVAAATQVGIRPEKIVLSLAPPEGSNVFRGRCASVSFLGDHSLYRIQAGGSMIVVKQSAKLPAACQGKELYLSFPADAVLVFPGEERAPEMESPRERVPA